MRLIDPLCNVHVYLTDTNAKNVFVSGNVQSLDSRLTGAEGRLMISYLKLSQWFYVFCRYYDIRHN